ncbi:unnamed protein product, partial [Closterium sp. NIES-53]
MEDSKKRKAEGKDGNGASGSDRYHHRVEELPAALTAHQARMLVDVMKDGDVREALVSAAMSHSAVADAIMEVVGRDSQQRRIFVRGLDFNTTNETLRRIFVSFGDVEDLQ